MLARAPGDVAHANVAQVTVPRSQRGSPRPAWGNGAACPATPGANAHGVPRTAITSANGAPSRPAGRVQPCRFDLLPPCTPITARQGHLVRTGRPVRRGSARFPVTRPRCHRRTVPGVTSPVRPQPSRQEPDQRGQHRAAGPVPPGRGQVRRSTATSCRSTSSAASLDAGERPSRTSQPASRTKIRQRRRKRHGRSSCPAATPHLSRQVTAIGRLLAPRRRIAAERAGRVGFWHPHTGRHSHWRAGLGGFRLYPVRL